MGHVMVDKAVQGGRRSSARRVRFKRRAGSLGLSRKRTRDLVRQIEQGLPYKALQSLSGASGLTAHEIGSVLAIPARTLARRRVSGRLSTDESERLLRLSNIFEKAVELFEGDVTAALSWLASPRKALGERTPLEYSRTELGAREVEALIGRLEHGVFS